MPNPPRQFKLQVDGYHDPGEPAEELFATLSEAEDRARERNLGRFSIWERRQWVRDGNGVWFNVRTSYRY